MSSSKKSTLISSFTGLLCLAAAGLPSAAQTYNVVGDFSISSNPNGAWSYGSSTGLAAAFIPSSIPSNNVVGLPLEGWLGTVDGFYPYQLLNTSAHNVTNANTVYQPGQLGLHPGPQGQYSVVRWTAPLSGTFSINATFSGLSLLGDSTDVHIFLDGVSIFNSTVNGTPAPTSYSGLQSIVAGDRIDFVVGNGGNGYTEDTTALTATIVPEQTTLGLVGMSLGCLFSLRFFKRKQ